MKKNFILMAVVIFLAGAFSAQAQIMWGVHVGTPSGGDIEGSNPAYGAHVTIPTVVDCASIEISATRLKDEADVVSIDITQIATTLRLSTLVADSKLKLYGGLGLSFNTFDAKVSLPGYKVDIESVIGPHVAAGITVFITENVELFGEYRYSTMDTVAEITNDRECRIVEDQYDIGLARVGVSFEF